MTMVVFLPFRPTRPPRPCLVSPKTSLPLPLASLVFRDYLSLPIGHYHLDRRRRGTPATRNVGCKTETSGIGPSFPTRTFITTHLGSLTSPRHAAAAGPWPARWLDLRRWRRGIARARGREASSGSQPPQVTYGSAAERPLTILHRRRRLRRRRRFIHTQEGGAGGRGQRWRRRVSAPGLQLG